MKPSRPLAVERFSMTKLANSPRVTLLAALLVSALAATSCRTSDGPRDLMMEEAVSSGSIERPVAMKGEATFHEGKVAALATITRGFDRGVGPLRRRAEGDDLSGRKKRDDGGAFTEVYNIGGYGDSEEDQKEAIADYVRLAKARRAAGSPMPPVTLRVQLENRGTEPMEIEVTEVNSYLGNFAVRPPVLKLAAGEKGMLEPMISQLGVTSDEIPLKLEVRFAGKKELQVVVVKNIIADSLRQEFEKAQR